MGRNDNYGNGTATTNVNIAANDNVYNKKKSRQITRITSDTNEII